MEPLEARHLLSGVSLLSVTPTLTSGSSTSSNPAISSDGRFVAFQGFAEDLVAIDANESEDVFVRDRDADEDGIFDELGEPGAVATTLISVNSDGTASGTGPSLFKGASVNPSISDDGRYVVFVSYATDLVVGVDMDETPNIFLRDRDTDEDGVYDEPGSAETFLVSVDKSIGVPESISAAGISGGPVASPFVGPTGAERPAISADGSFIAFASAAPDLILDDDTLENFNGATLDVYKVATADAGGPVSLVSMNFTATGTGAAVLAASGDPTISASGGLIAFQSAQTELVDPEKLPNPFLDVFVGIGGEPPELVSINAAGSGGGDGASFEPVISGDGKQVAFFSKATDLVKRDENGTTDVFVRDLVGGRTTLVSMSRTDPETGSGNGASTISSFESKFQGGPAVSGNGRFIAYASAATDLLDPEGGVTDGNIRPDVYVFDRDPDGNRVFDEPGRTETMLVSVNTDGTASGTHFASGVRGSFAPVISADGRYVAFVSSATDLIPGGTDGDENVYLRDLVEGTTILISAGIEPEPGDLGGSGPSGVVGLSSWGLAIPATAPRVAFSSLATDLDADTTDDNPAPDIYGFSPAGDILTSFVRTGGLTTGIAAMRAVYEPVGPFDVGVYLSDDALFDPGDELLATTTFENDPGPPLAAESIADSLLSFTIGPDGTPDEFPLPGTAEGELDESEDDYFILVVADPLDTIDEFDIDPFNEDNTGFLSGVYHLPDGSVFVHGRDLPTDRASSEKIVATTEGTELMLEFEGSIRGSLTYDMDDVTGVRVRAHRGDDTVVGSDMPDFIHGGPGDDRIDGGPGDDTINGGPGADTIFGGPGFDTIIDTDGDDTIDVGPDGGVVLSDPGSDDIFIGSEGNDTLDFSLSDLPITFDLDSEAVQTVDDDLNTIQLIGDWENLIGSAFDDDFSVGVGTIPLPPGGRTLTGGSGNDQLVIDAQGNPVINDGTKFEIPGLGTIFYSGFESIQVINTPPLIIDDGDLGYSAPGFTRIADPPFPQGLGDDVEYSEAGSGNTATWTFSDVAPGAYYVSATWTSAPDRATNAPYTIRDGGTGGPIAAELRINQEQLPGEFEDAGEFWRNLALVEVTGSTLTVELSDDADEYVLADAVRIEPLNTRVYPVGDLVAPILDDAAYTPESGFSSNGSSSTGSGFFGDHHTLDDPSESATWDFKEFTTLPDGPYVVSATWTAAAGLSDDARFQIDVDGSHTEVSVNQQLAPNDFAEGGGLWEQLAKIQIADGQLPIITLADPLGSMVIADAVRIDPAPNVELFVGATSVPNGGVVDLGTTAIEPTLGVATLHTSLRVLNSGIAPLSLANLAATGSGFTVTDFGEEVLPPGAATEFEIVFNTDTLGDFDGDGSFDTSDFVEFAVSFDLTAEVVDDLSPPIVEIVLPIDGASLIEGTDLGIEFDAVDDIGVSRVELLVDGEIMQTDSVWPFVFDFTLPALNGPTVEIGGRAFDIGGNTTDALPVTVNLLDDTPPTVEILAPSDGTSVIEGQTIPVLVGTSDDVGVTHVELLINGSVVDSSMFAPFDGQIVVPSGLSAFELDARATDSAGNTTTATINLEILPIVNLPAGGGIFDVIVDGDDVVVRREGGGEVFRRLLAGMTELQVRGDDNDDDTLKIDLTDLSVDLIHFDGGLGANDAIVVDSDRTYDTLIHKPTGPDRGSIEVDNSPIITYTGLEPILDNLAATNRVFQIDAPGDQQVRLRDDGNPNNGLMVLDSNGTGGFETITFTVPSESLTIAAGDGNDTINLVSSDSNLVPEVKVHGQAGNDALDGSTFDRSLFLDGGPGSDSLTGGRAPDRFMALDGEADRIFGNTDDVTPVPSVDFDPELDEVVIEPIFVDEPITTDGQIVFVPGTPDQDVLLHFEWIFREARYDNEVWAYAVDDAMGRVAGVYPGDPGYAQTAFNNAPWWPLFASGEGAGAQRDLVLPGGTNLAFLIIQDSTYEDLKYHNPNNKLYRWPLAFFSIEAANPDYFDHTSASELDNGGVKFIWEDLTFGGDHDFDDVVFTVNTVADNNGPVTATAPDPEGPQVPLTLGSVEFLELPDQNPNDGELWYRFAATRHGLLTVEGLVDHDNADFLLELWKGSRDGPPVATSTAVQEGQRIDWPTEAETEYYLRLTGDADVDLRLANLLAKSGTTLSIHGTDADDRFHFDPSSSLHVTINGMEYEFSDEEVTAVSFNGGGGTDTVILDDTPGDEMLTGRPGHLSYGNEKGDFKLEASDFEVLHAYARHGGYDRADLHDSPDFDKFKSEPAANYAKIYGRQLYHRTKFYEMIEVHSQGGGDLARLFDSDVNDTFEGQMDRSVFRNHVTEVFVHHFHHVIAYAGEGGHDVANFLPSGRKDEFHGKPYKAEYFDQATDGDLYRITARHYDEYHAAGTPQGGDKAKLWDTAHDDLLDANAEGATLYRNAGDLRVLYDALAFDMIKANGFNGGANRRDISDSVNWKLLFDGDWE